MYCTRCGHQMREGDVFCAKCGLSTNPAYRRATPSTLSRPMYDKKIAGVCAGFAHYFDVDVTLMRILWLAGFILTGGLLLLVYIAAWILMPREEAPPAAPQAEPGPETSRA
ncbi:MAG: PspC domain-containing protein [Rhodospirillales bacterium]